MVASEIRGSSTNRGCPEPTCRSFFLSASQLLWWAVPGVGFHHFPVALEILTRSCSREAGGEHLGRIRTYAKGPLRRASDNPGSGR